MLYASNCCVCPPSCPSFLAQHLINTYTGSPLIGHSSPCEGATVLVYPTYIHQALKFHTQLEANLGEKWDLEDIGNAGRIYGRV